METETVQKMVKFAVEKAQAQCKGQDSRGKMQDPSGTRTGAWSFRGVVVVLCMVSVSACDSADFAGDGFVVQGARCRDARLKTQDR